AERAAAARGLSRVPGDGLRARLSGVSPTQQDDCPERVGEPSQNGELVMTKPSAAHDALKIDASGHVGIGTPNPDPSVLLDVNGPAKVPTLIFPNLLGDKISLWGSTGSCYGLSIQADLL